MVETKAFRRTPDFEDKGSGGRNWDIPVLKPGYSLNPLPTLILLILGTVLAGHHQGSPEATMMHEWVGKFFVGAAAARCVTYLLIFISPPASTVPSRLPTEIVTSFCLCAGGVMLMASVSGFHLQPYGHRKGANDEVQNRDTVDAVISNGSNAILVATIDMGCIAALMAWGMGLYVLNGWAMRREERYLRRREKEIQ
jgi:hypothetical protein